MRTERCISILGCAVMFLSLFAALQPPRLYGQGRVNDKDIASMMRNLRDDAKSFRPSFDAAIRKSTIRKTSQAKDAKELAARFEKQTESMLNHFKQHHQGTGDLQNVMDLASRIQGFVYAPGQGPALDAQTIAKWEKIRAEIHQLASAYGLPDPS